MLHDFRNVYVEMKRLTDTCSHVIFITFAKLKGSIKTKTPNAGGKINSTSDHTI